jgi:hypothetical protein
MSRLKETFSSGSEFGVDGPSSAPACPSPTSPSRTDLRIKKKGFVSDLAELKGQK